mmetsp:Transcript_31073/g.89091  ORF Transcript_31073/g.89091 Transcript_31073/m.89091 type:complete len:208 (+) Transcript_31073:109-732(+)
MSNSFQKSSSSFSKIVATGFLGSGFGWAFGFAAGAEVAGLVPLPPTTPPLPAALRPLEGAGAVLARPRLATSSALASSSCGGGRSPKSPQKSSSSPHPEAATPPWSSSPRSRALAVPAACCLAGGSALALGPRVMPRPVLEEALADAVSPMPPAEGDEAGAGGAATSCTAAASWLPLSLRAGPMEPLIFWPTMFPTVLKAQDPQPPC